METKLVPIDVPEGLNVVVGQSHFIKTAEDIFEAMVNAVPGIKFGLAFCEASGARLVRCEGTSDELEKLAATNAMRLGAGHSFILYLQGTYPINILNALKSVPEVCNIHCASANPVQIVIVESEQGRGILGVIDGSPPVGIEAEKDINERREFLRKIGYKH